jgi:predicted ArsR family transcriptional regulator
MGGQDRSGEAARTGRRSEVLLALRSADAPRAVAQLAAALGVHPNTVRFHLDGLVADGQVEQVPTTRHGPGRPPARFRATRRMGPGGPRHYRLLAEILTEALVGSPDASARAVEAGLAWGRGLVSPAADADPGDEGHPPLTRLFRLLDELGFAPEPPAGDAPAAIGLRHCPFLELAEARARVVCPVHLGVMRGALAAWGAPLTVDRLEAFAEPDRCLAHLTPTGASS